MADSGKSLLDESINSNTEYLNWPGLKKLLNNINILPEDEWHLNKEYLNWPGLKELVENKNILPEDEWHLNKEYLNWPGLQYLWDKKIEPAIYQNTSVVKGKIDDENWYIEYDASDGQVYITLNEDNKNFYFDQDGSCGCIQNYNGMLQVVVNRDLSLMDDGFISNTNGKLYVNFDVISESSIYSCFGNGFWDNDAGWDNDDGWVN